MRNLFLVVFLVVVSACAPKAQTSRLVITPAVQPAEQVEEVPPPPSPKEEWWLPVNACAVLVTGLEIAIQSMMVAGVETGDATFAAGADYFNLRLKNLRDMAYIRTLYECEETLNELPIPPQAVKDGLRFVASSPNHALSGTLKDALIDLGAMGLVECHPLLKVANSTPNAAQREDFMLCVNGFLSASQQLSNETLQGEKNPEPAPEPATEEPLPKKELIPLSETDILKK